MIRAVIDTNLLISYILTQGATISRLIDHWEKGSFCYLASRPIIEELKDVLSRPRLRRKMRGDPQFLIDLVETETEQTAGLLVLEKDICRDPKDIKFIACAVEGDADYIVTGDKDLLDLGEYQGIKMIRVYQFVSILDVFG